jgi:hypothetical protein
VLVIYLESFNLEAMLITNSPFVEKLGNIAGENFPVTCNPISDYREGTGALIAALRPTRSELPAVFWQCPSKSTQMSRKSRRCNRLPPQRRSASSLTLP